MTSVVNSILDVFSEIGSWFAETVPTFYILFYDPETGLTFLGVLAVVAVGIAIILLIFRLINDFLNFSRG